MLGFSSNTWTRKIDHLQNFQYSVRSHTMKKKHFKHCSQTLPGKDTNEFLKYTIILRSPKPSFYFKNLHELHGDLSTPFDHVASSDNNITQSIMEEISKIYKVLMCIWCVSNSGYSWIQVRYSLISYSEVFWNEK